MFNKCLNNLAPSFEYKIDHQLSLCGISPEVGNNVLPDQILKSFEEGNFNNVPIMAGVAWNEGLGDVNAVYDPFIGEKEAQRYEAGTFDKTKKTLVQWINEVVDLKNYTGNSTARNNLLSKKAKMIYEAYPYDVSAKLFNEIYFKPEVYNGFDSANPDNLDAHYVFFSLYNDWAYYCPTKKLAKSILANNKFTKDKQPLYLFRLRKTNALRTSSVT
jgi:hypothetical protein